MTPICIKLTLKTTQHITNVPRDSLELGTALASLVREQEEVEETNQGQVFRPEYFLNRLPLTLF